MNLQQYSAGLETLVSVTSERAINSVILPAGNELLATIKRRIQLDGKNSNYRDIGQYSTKPAYYKREQFDRKGVFKPGFKAHVETSQKIKYNEKTNSFKPGKITERVVKKKMETMYLQGGYKELRDIQGKPTEFVNLTYRTDLMLDYQQYSSADTVVQGFTKETEVKKRKALEIMFKGDIFKPSRFELEEYRKNVAIDIANLQKEIITHFA